MTDVIRFLLAVLIVNVAQFVTLIAILLRLSEFPAQQSTDAAATGVE